MIELLNNIYIWIEVLIRDLLTSFEALLSIVKFAPEAILTYMEAVLYVPLQIRLYITIIVTLSLIYLLIGR